MSEVPVAATPAESVSPDPSTPQEQAPAREGLRPSHELEHEAREAFNRAKAPPPTKEQVKETLKKVGVEASDKALESKGGLDPLYISLTKKAQKLAEREARVAAREKAQGAPQVPDGYLSKSDLQKLASEDLAELLARLEVDPSAATKSIFKMQQPETKVEKLERTVQDLLQKLQDKESAQKKAEEEQLSAQQKQARFDADLEGLKNSGNEEVALWAELNPPLAVSALRACMSHQLQRFNLTEAQFIRGLQKGDFSEADIALLDRLVMDELSTTFSGWNARIRGGKADKTPGGLKNPDEERGLPRGQMISNDLASDDAPPVKLNRFPTSEELEAEAMKAAAEARKLTRKLGPSLTRASARPGNRTCFDGYCC
jgi:hypothetical protein